MSIALRFSQTSWLQWGRVLMNAERCTLAFDVCLLALQWGRVLMNAESMARILQSWHVPRCFNGAAFL